MTERTVDANGMEIETPAYGSRYVVLIVLVAAVTVAMQFALTYVAADHFWYVDRTSIPIVTSRYIPQPGLEALPGNVVELNGELWVCPQSTANSMRGRNVLRSAVTQLVTIDLTTREPRDSGIELSPAPVGLLVIDDQIFAVSETNVSCIQNKQLVVRHPRRALQQPTKPFAYEGKLAVIDKNKDDVYALLTWNDGEWFEVGQVEAPTSADTSTWFIPELRVVTDGDATHLFYCDAQAMHYRQGIVLIPADAPVSAMTPANIKPALRDRSVTIPPGWTRIPLAVSWNLQWDVAIVNGQVNLFSISSSGRNQTILRHILRDGQWTPSQPGRPYSSATLSAVSGSPGYVVTSGLHLLAADDFQSINPAVKAMPTVDRTGSLASLLFWLLPNLIASSFSVVCVWRLMRKFRSTHYLYGKRTAVQASLLRRGMARAIDTALVVLPSLSLVWVANEEQWMATQSNRPQEPMVLFFLFVFSLWCGTTLVVSFMEGIWGITPGKHLCGIRTLRTTLRPCGMLRSLARGLMIYADSLMLLVWLPGILTIALTRNWQRLGDLVSDTVVVVGSLHDASASE